MIENSPKGPRNLNLIMVNKERIFHHLPPPPFLERKGKKGRKFKSIVSEISTFLKRKTQTKDQFQRTENNL